MKSKRLSDGLRNAGGDDEIIAVAKQFLDGMKPGDLLWVKHRQTSWWPAQVVDENTVSGRYKPHKRTSTTILVRLYGTYKYLFVDPMKCLSEFEDALKRHKGDMQMMFQKALKKASPESISKTEGSKSSKLDASGHEEVKQLGRKRMKLMGDSAKEPTPEESGDLGVRRLKVMQGLGLVAPPGSPFYRTGHI
ncbi:hypothetical protein Dimus_006268 [Dionaea muscipula]